MNLIGNKWDEILDEEYHKDYFKKIVLYINKAYKERPIYPPKSYILRALSLTDYDNVKVVILGQDPYHGTGEANGLAFAVNNGIKLPPSLKNIYKELNSDLNQNIYTSMYVYTSLYVLSFFSLIAYSLIKNDKKYYYLCKQVL